jgi:hypothetical protein
MLLERKFDESEPAAGKRISTQAFGRQRMFFIPWWCAS